MYTWARTGTRKELVDKLNNGEQKKSTKKILLVLLSTKILLEKYQKKYEVNSINVYLSTHRYKERISG